MSKLQALNSVPFHEQPNVKIFYIFPFSEIYVFFKALFGIVVFSKVVKQYKFYLHLFSNINRNK